MARTIGVAMAERMAMGLIEDHKIAGAVQSYPEKTRTSKTDWSRFPPKTFATSSATRS